MKNFFNGAIIFIALALGCAYLAYLYMPAKQGELNYFLHLPAALSGLFIFSWKNIQALGWTLLLALAGLGLGFLLLEKICRLRLPAGFLLGTGTGLLGLLIFLLGALHLLMPNLLKALVCILAFLGIAFGFLRVRGLKKIRLLNWAEAGLVLVFSLVLMLVLVHPTYFYDALSYHLALPRQYLLRNSLAPIPSISYSYFPELAEMIYLAGLALSGPTTAQLSNLVFFLAIILLGREAFQLWFSLVLRSDSSSPCVAGLLLCEALRKARVAEQGAPLRRVAADKKALATISLLSLPVFSYMSGVISNDILVAFFILAGAYALSCDELAAGQRGLLFGIVLGLACSTKLNAYLYMLLPQGAWLAYVLFTPDRKKAARGIIIAALAFAIVCSPFWLRNILTVGNPFYPALAGILGGPLSAEQTSALWQDAHGVSLSTGIWRELFRLPHDFSYAPIVPGRNISGTHFFPLFGAALPAGLVLLLLKRPGRKLAPVLLYCLAFYLLWCFSFRLSRFALGLWVILAVLSAGGFSLLREKSKAVKQLAGMALGISVVMGLVLSLLAGARLNGWNMLTRSWSQDEYLLRIASVRPIEMGAYPAYQWLNRNAGSNDQVALVGPSAFFYLERKALASSFIDWNPLVVLFGQGKSASEVCEMLNRDRVSWLVYQPGELARLASRYPVNRLPPLAEKSLDDFFPGPCLEKVMSNESRRIYLFRILPAR